MSEQDFQHKVIGSLERIEEKLKNVCEDTEGHRKTLYGPDGRGGLVKDVEQSKARQSTWNKLLAIGNILSGGIIAAIVAWLKWGNK